MPEAAATKPAAAPTHKARPEKPNEEQYKTDLSKAEKEHTTAQEKLVSSNNFLTPLTSHSRLPVKCL